MSNTLNATRLPEGVAGRTAKADPAALQALASKAGAAPVDGASRRGPFRPEVWLNARQKHGSRLSVHYFRTVDVLAVIAVTLACGWAVSPDNLMALEIARAAPMILGAVVVLGLMKSLGLYQFDRQSSLTLHLVALTGVVATASVLALGLGGLLRGPALELEAIGVWAGATLLTVAVLHALWSGLVAHWRDTGALTPNIVVVGATRHAERLIKDALKRRDINVLGVFDDRLARNPDSVEGVPVLGAAEALLNHKITPYVDRIVLAIDPEAQARVRELTARLQTLPNEVTLLVDPQGEEERTAALTKLARAPLASLNAADADRRAFHKRLQDIVIGGLGLIAVSPVIAICALAVKLDSPGPVFFRQRRHGFNQEAIVVWKFRSMRQETSDATASRQVTADDDRITKVGKFLRKTSLDELPQLLNVLTGEMSLVGPRPHAIGMKTGQVESALLVAEYAHRHRIKPGMTGWAAIKGSRGPLDSAHDVRRRVQLDVDYIERQSFWLDLWIMAVTLPVLLGDRSAVR
ncbi:exopolysaccharide biosynthesis polyprenyl glycosylphosphotransferase [Brevundimonas goettingensis]|uniref:Exopolysaccharide biosynthesis polyprenyl glycosylphosphotransferase n=1 Tax=Brevundimonas goettingensis TaxID=2774190 RepID=A0A975C439_9CAUL|nr:exopolysaccharide biosynthesis polyprenyl glycosylphosphotransferase [Brevundimonas goettingensis]QTC92522.1 exopolysaccharide biosynthesis polyprenyl glycosylphosphotransferase [Brevundimonas goettingensis]